MWGWTKLGAHARWRTSIFKTAPVFFSGQYGFSVLPSSLQSVIYSCPHRTSPFLESMAATWTTAMLNFLPFSLSGAVSDTLRVYYTGLACDYGYCSQQFSCHCSYAWTCLDHELWVTWAGFHVCPCAIKLCLPRVYPEFHARDEIYQASPLELLSRNSMGTRLLSDSTL